MVAVAVNVLQNTMPGSEADAVLAGGTFLFILIAVLVIVAVTGADKDE